MRRYIKYCIISVLTCSLLIPCRDTHAVGIQAGVSNLTPNVNRSDGTVVCFAGQEWWVIGYKGTGVFTKKDDAKNVTLLLKSFSNRYGSVAFREKNTTGGSGWTEYPVGSETQYEGAFVMPSDYSDSTLQRKMANIAGNTSLFPAKELALINQRTLFSSTQDSEKDEIGGAVVSGQKLWALSQNEWTEISDNTVLSFDTFFWMRSPYVDKSAIFGFPTGGQLFFKLVESDLAVRPAFNLNLLNVLFTTAANSESGKESVKPNTLSLAGELFGPIKFTVEISDASFLSIACSDTAERIVKAGDTVRILYSGAKIAANKCVSCVIVSKEGILYYGKMSSAAKGAVSFIVPDGISDGIYTIRLFNEECNGNNETDFTCRPVSIPLMVVNPAPTLY